MSKANAIKTFRDMLSFLTIIPLAKTEEFVHTSSKNMYLFPVIGAFIGICSVAYLFSVRHIILYLLNLANCFVQIPIAILFQAIPAAMTIAFLLVFTGFQHFDGIVDLGNAIGVKKIEDRREIAHRWVVTYKGGLLAMFVEFAAFAGLFYLSGNIALRVLIVAEVTAKLAMVTIVWRGKAPHEGLGARFIANAKRKLNYAAYGIAFLIGYILLGYSGLIVVALSVLFGLGMKKVGDKVFGGVSGDMIGATNEVTRALTLVI
ncbi:MAG: hypothetical protein GX638_12710, partial [Crenarchaeota archaeon]|nr:hypothetical protein [Thermoproteota archaeon]